MGWITENKGWLVACLVSAVAGALLVLWLKGSKPKTVLPSPIVDTPAPVQPDFDVPDLGAALPPDDDGGAIDTLTKPPIPPKTESQPVESHPEPSPCKPFSLRLKSSPTLLSDWLDSLVVFYEYPSGANSFEYYNRPQITGQQNTKSSNRDVLSFGVAIAYIRYQNNLSGSVYGRLRLSGLNLKTGYHHQTRQQLSWFVSVGKEWRIF